jgi:hypothetical protein
MENPACIGNHGRRQCGRWPGRGCRCDDLFRRGRRPQSATAKQQRRPEVQDAAAVTGLVQREPITAWP